MTNPSIPKGTILTDPETGIEIARCLVDIDGYNVLTRDHYKWLISKPNSGEDVGQDFVRAVKPYGVTPIYTIEPSEPFALASPY